MFNVAGGNGEFVLVESGASFILADRPAFFKVGLDHCRPHGYGPAHVLVSEWIRPALDRVRGENRGRHHSWNRGDRDMGINGWRNLSVLLLAGAALVGCNNTTPNKQTTIVQPKPGEQPTGVVQQNKGPFNGAGQPIGSSNPNTAFPTSPSPGLGQSPLNSSINPNSPSPVIDPGKFQPYPPSGSNVQPPNPFGQQPNLNSSVPSVQKPSPFADTRTNVQPGVPPTTIAPDPFNISVPRPENYNKQQ
jgi:hypothetical protein